MRFFRRRRQPDEPFNVPSAVDEEREKERIVIKEMDAGLRHRDSEELLNALISGSITNDEYDEHKLRWQRERTIT
jgi:hypothetical protein